MPTNNKGVVHERFFGRRSNQLSGRFEVNPGPKVFEAERRLLNEVDEQKKSALVAQPAERRFRKP